MDYQISSALKVTHHARLRQSQRNLPDEALDYVLSHGTQIYRTGVRCFFLRRRDVPASDRHVDRVARLAGTVVMEGKDGAMITTYRNPKALKDLRKKTKYRRSSRSRADIT